MYKFNGVITVSLEKRYNKTSVKAANNDKIVRVAYNDSKPLQANMAIAARTLATDCGIESQEYYVLSHNDDTLFVTPDTLNKITF
jgi:hypothetical protein